VWRSHLYFFAPFFTASLCGFFAPFYTLQCWAGMKDKNHSMSGSYLID